MNLLGGDRPCTDLIFHWLTDLFLWFTPQVSISISSLLLESHTPSPLFFRWYMDDRSHLALVQMPPGNLTSCLSPKTHLRPLPKRCHSQMSFIPATINNAEVQHVRRVTPYVQNPSVRHEKARRYFQLDIHGPLAMQRVFCILDNYPWWNCSTHPPVQKKKNQAIVSALKRWRMRLLNALKPHQAQISIVNEYDLGKKKRMLLHRASF